MSLRSRRLNDLQLVVSFAGLGFLACYLAGKMHLWDKRGHRVSSSCACAGKSSLADGQTRAWWAMSPLLGGIMVAISRTEDNRHHWQDVLVGSLLGMFIAWVSYRSYYRKLTLDSAPVEIVADADSLIPTQT